MTQNRKLEVPDWFKKNAAINRELWFMILSYYYFKLGYFGKQVSSQTEKENEGVEKKFFFFGVV